MKQTIERKWEGYPYKLEIDLEVPWVFFRVDGSLPPIVNRFEEFALEVFISDLEPHGIDPKKVRWFYEVTTYSQIHSAEVKLTLQNNFQLGIYFTRFQALDIKIVNR